MSVMESDVSEICAEGIESAPLWRTIEAVAKEEGVELFDIDFPRDGGASGRSGVVRVYITKRAGPVETASDDESGGRGGVTFEDCVRVTKKLLDLDEKEPFVPESCVLEVSSPGINRTLRLPEHFEGAVGERVRIKFRSTDGTYHVVTGTLSASRGDEIEVSGEGMKEEIRVSLPDIKEARVDFKF